MGRRGDPDLLTEVEASQLRYLLVGGNMEDVLFFYLSWCIIHAKTWIKAKSRRLSCLVSIWGSNLHHQPTRACLTTTRTPFMVYLPLFNTELKFVSSITPSYELQIWWFFLLIFSKIMNFHLVSFVCMTIAIIRSFFLWLICFYQIEYRKNMLLHDNG